MTSDSSSNSSDDESRNKSRRKRKSYQKNSSDNYRESNRKYESDRNDRSKSEICTISVVTINNWSKGFSFSVDMLITSVFGPTPTSV